MVIELLFMGAAWHKDPGMNNVNPGLGVLGVLSEEPLLSGNGTVQTYAGAAVYKDSYSVTAVVGGVGVRGVLGDPKGLNYGPDLLIGYRSAEIMPGPVAVPSAYIGYGNLKLHGAIMSPTLDAAGVFLRYDIKIP